MGLVELNELNPHMVHVMKSIATMNSLAHVNDVFISIKVIDLGSGAITSRDYFHLGRVTEFRYGAKLGTVFRKWKGEKLCYTKYVVFCFESYNQQS